VLIDVDPARTALSEPDWLPDTSAYDPTEPAQGDRERLLNALSFTPMAVDELIRATGLSQAVMQTLLLDLDLEGRLEWSAGQLVALRP